MAQNEPDTDSDVHSVDADAPETLQLPDSESPGLRDFLADIVSIIPVALCFGGLGFVFGNAISGILLNILREGALNLTEPVPAPAVGMGAVVGGVVFCAVVYYGAVEGNATLRDKYGRG